MAGDLGTVILVALLGVTTTGAKYIHSGFKRRKQRELIEETPTAEVESVSIGPAELTGTAEVLSEAFEAPFTDDDCLYVSWEIEEWHETDEGDSWVTREEGTNCAPFVLDDGTGEIRVDADESAEWEVRDGSDRWRVDADESPPPGIRSFLEESDDIGPPDDPSLLDRGKQHGDRRYRQEAIRPGDDVYVYGAVRTDGTGDETSPIVGPDTERVDTEMFFISDATETTLLDQRDWTLLWRLPAGAALVALGIGGLYLFLF